MSSEAKIVEEIEILGRSGKAYVPESLMDEEFAWQFLVNGTLWPRVAKERTTEQIADLIRGLVLYCRASKRQIGMSVSPVIGLYRELVRRAPPWEPELTSWVVENRTNRYEPFGTSKGSGRSYAEYVENKRTFEKWREEGQVAQRKEERAGRLARERKLATERLANAVRRGDLTAVQAMLAKGADTAAALPEGGSLVAHAETHGRTAMANFLRSRNVK